MAGLFYMIMKENQMGNQICMRPWTYVTDGVGIIRLIWLGNRVIGMQNKESKLPVREAGKGRMHVHV